MSRRFLNFKAALQETDALLFTPGPLSTSPTVKAAMLHDWGSRDSKMIELIQSIRSEILSVANVSSDDYTTILVQGSGTFAVEATITSTIPPDGKILVLANGAYGARAAKIAEVAKIDFEILEYPEDEIPNLSEIEKTLSSNNSFTHVICIHSETTSGIVNPVEQIGQIVKKYNCTYIVDAMSSFGAIPVDFYKGNIDYLVSSANKCIQGVPGFAFCVAKNESINKTKGFARSLSLDLYSQVKGLDKNGQFRFTPPTHTMIAFQQALEELREEGGVEARYNRYAENQQICTEGLKKLGFETYVKEELAGPIITSYRYPTSDKWDFETFYSKLAERDFVIYPGKVSNADCFRIGHIGHVFQQDTRDLLVQIEKVLGEMGM